MNINFNSSYSIPAAAGAPPLSLDEKKTQEIEDGVVDSSIFYLDHEEVIDSYKSTVRKITSLALHPHQDEDEEISLNPPPLSIEKTPPQDPSVDLEDKDYVRINEGGEFEFFITADVVKTWQVQLIKEKNIKKRKGIKGSVPGHVRLTESQEDALDKTSELKEKILDKLYHLKVKYAIPNPVLVKSPIIAQNDFQALLKSSPTEWVLSHFDPKKLYFDTQSDRKYRTLHISDKEYQTLVSNPALVFHGCYIPNSKYNMQGKEAALFAQAELRMSIKKKKKLGAVETIENAWEIKDSFKSTMRLLWTNITAGKSLKDGTDSIGTRRIDTKMLRRIFSRNTNSCADWNPTYYKAIVHLLKRLPGFCGENEKIHVIDPSLGWGGRLIGALGTAEIDSITGFDPNTSLIPGYKKILKYLAPLTSATAKIFVKPSEEMTAKDFEPNRKYKLILTSPPYAHLEEYSDEETQSLRYLKKDGQLPANPDIALWIRRFMHRMLFKAWKRLDDNGVIALNLADITVRTKNFSLCEPTLAFLHKLGLTYRGCIGLQFFNTYEPIWVFQKIPEHQKYGTYDLTFKNKDHQTLDQLAARYKEFYGLPHDEQAWRQSFFLPKLNNSLRKYYARQLVLGNHPKVIENQVSEALGIAKERVQLFFSSDEKRRWIILSGKGDEISETMGPQALLRFQNIGIKRSAPIA